MKENSREKTVRKVSLIGIIMNFLLLCIKLYIGILSKSQAMIADGINSAGDIFASAMGYIGSKLSSKPRDLDHPYGHGKAEYVFSELISISMICAAAVMINNSIKSIVHNQKMDFSIWLVVVCAVTIVTKLVLFIYTRVKYKKHDSILIKASKEDHRNDMFVTSGTMIGILASLLGYNFVDGIIGSLISIWIGYVGFKLFLESYRVLMDTNIPEDQQDKIIDISKEFHEILHIDSITSKPVGDKYLVIIKMSMIGEKTLNECHKISGIFKERIIDEFSFVYDTVIHINPH